MKYPPNPTPIPIPNIAKPAPVKRSPNAKDSAVAPVAILPTPFTKENPLPTYTPVSVVALILFPII